MMRADFVDKARAWDMLAEKSKTIASLRFVLGELSNEARTACDARKFPSLTAALAEADAALLLADAALRQSK